MRRLILVHGDKGGIGKTHVAQLTAAVLRQQDHPVTLVDGDANNPGLHRYFKDKPDPVLLINVRKPEGVDELLNAFLEGSGDMLVDLPAGGRDLTTQLLCDGPEAGTADITALFQETGDRLVILFVISPLRESVVALSEELGRFPAGGTDWIIVKNHHLNEPFTRFDRWAENTKLQGVTVIDMPSLDNKVVELLVDAQAHIGEIEAVPAASALTKMRAKAALREWRGALERAGFLNAN